MNREIRTYSDKIEVRKADGKVTIRGYAAVFNSFSEDLGGFKEIIRPGAFKNAIASGQDVRALVNHNEDLLMGRTASGTLRLAEDDRGLRYDIDPPDTTAARDVVALLERGDISGSSFAFSIRGDAGQNWREEGDDYIREIYDVDLYDVGPVVYPAYPATVSEAARRSLSELRGTKVSPELEQVRGELNEMQRAIAQSQYLRYQMRLIGARMRTIRIGQE